MKNRLSAVIALLGATLFAPAQQTARETKVPRPPVVGPDIKTPVQWTPKTGVPAPPDGMVCA